MSTLISEKWLKRLAPGTLLYEKGVPGFLLVYHVEVEEFPGPWRQLHIWVLDSRHCKLRMLNVESGTFRDKWMIVDVNP